MNAHFSRNQSSYLKKMWPFYGHFEKYKAFIFFFFLNAPSLKGSVIFQTLNIKVNTVWQLLCSKLMTFSGL